MDRPATKHFFIGFTVKLNKIWPQGGGGGGGGGGGMGEVGRWSAAIRRKLVGISIQRVTSCISITSRFV